MLLQVSLKYNYNYEKTEDIKMKLQKPFSIYFNCNLQKHRSIAIVYSSRMQLLNSEKYVGHIICKSTHLVSRCKKVDILLGDFNINGRCNEAYAGVKNALTQYALMIIELTHLDGRFSNHVYLRKKFNGKACKL